MKKVDRWAALTAALLLTVSLAPASQAAEAGEKIVILHTNDVHCALDDAIGYAGLAAYAGALEEQYGADRVTLDVYKRQAPHTGLGQRRSPPPSSGPCRHSRPPAPPGSPR